MTTKAHQTEKPLDAAALGHHLYEQWNSFSLELEKMRCLTNLLTLNEGELPVKTIQDLYLVIHPILDRMDELFEDAYHRSSDYIDSLPKPAHIE